MGLTVNPRAARYAANARVRPPGGDTFHQVTDPDLRLLSLGAGVQSTVLALLACDGTLPGLDAAIFADTGWEPHAVYSHLGQLAAELAAAGIPLYRVSQGNLRHDSINPGHRFASVPYFVRNPDGSSGMGRRQCTSEYKLAPINRKVRELLGAAPPDFKRVPAGRLAEQWIGFSTDEVARVSDHRPVRYSRKRYPLLELGMSRDDCRRYLQRAGWGSVVKSACIGCPFHGNAQWRALRDTCRCRHHLAEHLDDAQHRIGCRLCDCDEFANPEWHDAIAFDAAIRKGGARGLPLNGEAFLHRSRIPLALAPIDHRTRGERAADQLDLLDELGDPDGCSPYGCRSGAPV